AAVMMFTMDEDPEQVSRALRAGAQGYMLKSSDPDVVIEGLRVVGRGGVVLGPRVGLTVLTSLHRDGPRLPPPLDKLSSRELRILAHLRAGHTNGVIARDISVTEKTVRNLLSMLYAKTRVADRAQATLLAEKAGLQLDHL
ncbi:LuxR C-terminal-related transcriptional regulator, partial [Motilibacter deserti]